MTSVHHITHLELLKELVLLPFLCLKYVHCYGISHCIPLDLVRRFTKFPRRN